MFRVVRSASWRMTGVRPAPVSAPKKLVAPVLHAV